MITVTEIFSKGKSMAMLPQAFPNHQRSASSPIKATFVVLLRALLCRLPWLAIRLGAAVRHMWVNFQQA
jgi:hypothetical protein